MTPTAVPTPTAPTSVRSVDTVTTTVSPAVAAAQWNEAHEAAQRELPGPEWLARRRREAMARFTALGIPTTRLEAWKYTNAAPIGRAELRQGVPITAEEVEGTVDALAVGGVPLASLGAHTLLFIDGRIAPGLGDGRIAPTGTGMSPLEVPALPGGARLVSLAAALSEDALATRIQQALGAAATGERAFVALNTAALADGALLLVPAGVVLEEPLHVLFASSHGVATQAHPRLLVILEKGAQATLIESYAGPDGRAYFTNSVSEVLLGQGAVLDHYRLQLEGNAAFHVGALDVRQERGSTLRTTSLSFGAGLARIDVAATLGGEGAECEMNGLFVAGGSQHVDHHTFIDHASPHCTSRELYKGVLDGSARGIFYGRIVVRPDAQKSDAVQTNRNLLLSKDALVNSTPQLEISADDVKCKHASTIGQIAPDALFYMRSRGIGESEARELLTFAFASDVVGGVRVPALAAALQTALGARLHGSGQAS